MKKRVLFVISVGLVLAFGVITAYISEKANSENAVTTPNATTSSPSSGTEEVSSMVTSSSEEEEMSSEIPSSKAEVSSKVSSSKVPNKSSSVVSSKVSQNPSSKPKTTVSSKPQQVTSSKASSKPRTTSSKPSSSKTTSSKKPLSEPPTLESGPLVIKDNSITEIVALSNVVPVRSKADWKIVSYGFRPTDGLPDDNNFSAVVTGVASDGGCLFRVSASNRSNCEKYGVLRREYEFYVKWKALDGSGIERETSTVIYNGK